MYRFFSIFSLFSALFLVNSLQAVAIFGTLLVDPTTGHCVYLIGDLHENSCIKGFRGSSLSFEQKEDVLSWAATLNATLIVEDKGDFWLHSPDTLSLEFIDQHSFLIGMAKKARKQENTVYNVEYKEDWGLTQKAAQEIDFIINNEIEEYELDHNEWFNQKITPAKIVSQAISSQETKCLSQTAEFWAKIDLVDARIAARILSLSTDTITIVCAGALHVLEVSNFLQSQGYKVIATLNPGNIPLTGKELLAHIEPIMKKFDSPSNHALRINIGQFINETLNEVLNKILLPQYQKQTAGHMQSTSHMWLHPINIVL